jgi:hypothetical protein
VHILTSNFYRDDANNDDHTTFNIDKDKVNDNVSLIGYNNHYTNQIKKRVFSMILIKSICENSLELKLFSIDVIEFMSWNLSNLMCLININIMRNSLYREHKYNFIDVKFLISHLIKITINGDITFHTSELFIITVMDYLLLHGDLLTSFDILLKGDCTIDIFISKYTTDGSFNFSKDCHVYLPYLKITYPMIVLQKLLEYTFKLDINTLLIQTNVDGFLNNKFANIENIMFNLMKPISNKYLYVYLKIIIDFVESVLCVLINDTRCASITRAFIFLTYSNLLSRMNIDYQYVICQCKGDFSNNCFDFHRYTYCSLLLYLIMIDDMSWKEKV